MFVYAHPSEGGGSAETTNVLNLQQNGGIRPRWLIPMSKFAYLRWWDR